MTHLEHYSRQNTMFSGDAHKHAAPIFEHNLSDPNYIYMRQMESIVSIF